MLGMIGMKWLVAESGMKILQQRWSLSYCINATLCQSCFCECSNVAAGKHIVVTARLQILVHPDKSWLVSTQAAVGWPGGRAGGSGKNDLIIMQFLTIRAGDAVIMYRVDLKA